MNLLNKVVTDEELLLHNSVGAAEAYIYNKVKLKDVITREQVQTRINTVVTMHNRLHVWLKHVKKKKDTATILQLMYTQLGMTEAGVIHGNATTVEDGLKIMGKRSSQNPAMNALE